MAVAETVHDTHHHDHHEHGEFIAHHFDSAEQQYDSGKLGIWVFLVTEILFFSGLFVAYTLWRSHHPEIFQQAHVFLDKQLGAVNTVVLLFSSLTMAWAVRSAQLGDNRNVARMVLITMVCAAVFLGVKAVEYSHKWDLGILPASLWSYTGAHAAPTGPLAVSLGISDYLVSLSLIPAILLVAFAGLSVFMKLTDKGVWSKFFLALVITLLGYFGGAVGGVFYMRAMEPAHDDHALAAPMMLHASSLNDDKPAASPDDSHDDHAHEEGDHAAGHAAGADPHLPPKESLDRDVRIFFSIYYCMTGLHAIHIIGGIAFLSWIYFRSIRGHWRSDYFGPVDYVGLYWHIVDLIWIYLFPMLYLID